jgi:hypothetical protein
MYINPKGDAKGNYVKTLLFFGEKQIYVRPSTFVEFPIFQKY